jgi:hypothetical protein
MMEQVTTVRALAFWKAVLEDRVVMDETRRPTKRQKDLADIARLLESDPSLRKHVPAEVLARLV